MYQQQCDTVPWSGDIGHGGNVAVGHATLISQLWSSNVAPDCDDYSYYIVTIYIYIYYYIYYYIYITIYIYYYIYITIYIYYYIYITIYIYYYIYIAI